MIADYRAAIVTAATAYHLDPLLVEALVMQESAGHWYAYRYEKDFYPKYLADKPEYNRRPPEEVSASIGLCQVMFSTAREHGFTGEPWDLFAPTVNLDVGCRVLAGNLAWARGRSTGGLAAGDERRLLTTGLAAYNAGRGGIRTSAGMAYATSVLARYDRLRGRT